jgi:4-amino-4-deoxy-L-arabinose transferase-like glycosyltransferase
LALIAAAALFLFFFGASQAYRSDEVWSLRAVSMPAPAMMAELKSDIHPPLYYLMLRGWRVLVGENEIAIRALSILLTLAAAAFVYTGARDQWGPRAGLLAAAVFITSPLATLAAQMVRMYALLALASAASTAAFLRLTRDDPPNKANWVLYVAANVLGSFTHVWFFFLLLAQGLVYLVHRRTSRLAAMVAAAILSLAPYALVWLPVLLAQFKKSSAAIAWVDPPRAIDLLGTVLFLGGLFTFATPFLIKKLPNKPNSAWLPLGVALLAIVIPFALSFWKPVYGQRFTVVALPAFAIATGSLASHREHGYRLETGLIAASCALAAILNLYNSQCDARSAAAYLARTTQPGDTVVFTSLSRLPIDYYWNRLQPNRRVTEQSFPAEIDSHPGFEGAIHTDAARPRLIAEAHQLKRQNEPKAGKLFLLHGFHPRTDALLRSAFDQGFTPLKTLNHSCASMGSYFQYISAYACTSQLAAK